MRKGVLELTIKIAKTPSHTFAILKGGIMEYRKHEKVQAKYRTNLKKTKFTKLKYFWQKAKKSQEKSILEIKKEYV